MLDGEEGVRPEDLPRLRRVGHVHMVRLGAVGAVAGRLRHLRAVRRQQPPRRGGGARVGERGRVRGGRLVEPVQVCGHDRERLHPGPGLAAEAQAEHVPARVGVGEQQRGTVRRAGAAGPDPGDAVDHAQPTAGCRQKTGVRERLPAEQLGHPQRRHDEA
ncbi:hypothetical protein [Streptomyces monashensis]|uniref:hypothetical protein n=1 Tax=Streptomyces monashensis TaxID=1678012 RepID=UPI0015A5082B|nr:hypothetical protein [Streptomyces monashensis]